MIVTRIDTPVGEMVAAAAERAVCLLDYADSRWLELDLRQLEAVFGAAVEGGDSALLAALREQLGEYFAGRRRDFDLPLALVGTPFQKRVWESLRTIPYGGTVSYGEQAASLGCPAAVRAVAGANGRNRLSIILPCHRVIGSDGTLTGYGGGLDRKKRLLDLEAAALL